MLSLNKILLNIFAKDFKPLSQPSPPPPELSDSQPYILLSYHLFCLNIFLSIFLIPTWFPNPKLSLSTHLHIYIFIPPPRFKIPRFTFSKRSVYWGINPLPSLKNTTPSFLQLQIETKDCNPRNIKVSHP